MNYTVCFKKACGTLKLDQFYCGFSVRDLVEDMAKEQVIPKGAKLLWVAKSDNIAFKKRGVDVGYEVQQKPS